MLTSILASILALVTLTTPVEVYANQDAQNEDLTFNNFIQILDFQDAYEQGSSEIHGRNLKKEVHGQSGKKFGHTSKKISKVMQELRSKTMTRTTVIN